MLVKEGVRVTTGLEDYGVLVVMQSIENHTPRMWILSFSPYSFVAILIFQMVPPKLIQIRLSFELRTIVPRLFPISMAMMMITSI
jgi:hypothetical protein